MCPMTLLGIVTYIYIVTYMRVTFVRLPAWPFHLSLLDDRLKSVIGGLGPWVTCASSKTTYSLLGLLPAG